jgi:hypothetical protein
VEVIVMLVDWRSWSPWRMAASGSGTAAAVATLPPVAVVFLGLIAAIAAFASRYMLAREQTRRLEVGMIGAAKVYEAGGDGAAVARGLRVDVTIAARRPPGRLLKRAQ